MPSDTATKVRGRKARPLEPRNCGTCEHPLSRKQILGKQKFCSQRCWHDSVDYMRPAQ